MKIYFRFIFVLILVILTLSSCMSETPISDNAGKDKNQDDSHSSDHEEEEVTTVYLSTQKFNTLGMKIGYVPTRILSGVVNANGWLEIFPQHKAIVTTILGANITEIKVIEGEKIKKNQILAYLSHPNLVNLQTSYIRTYNQMQFLEKEYYRQKRLYDEKISSGKIFQQALADYQSIKGEVDGYKAQLNQLNIDEKSLRKGKVFQYVPLTSPIDGYIEKILVQTGQFVDPQAQIFTIINNDYLHLDLMVFEKDALKVKIGQKVSFKVGSVQDKNLTATIVAIEKSFERNPRVVRAHASIDKNDFSLIPGMYAQGNIYTESTSVNALPEEAIIVENGKTYIFLVDTNEKGDEKEWAFTPVEIKTGITNDGWVEIKPFESLPQNTLVALNNGYYLISEMKKGITSHQH